MGVSYIQDDSLIVFVQVEDNHKLNGYHRKNIGLNHMAFKVKNNATVDVIRESLKQKGVVELYGEKYLMPEVKIMMPSFLKILIGLN